MKTKASIVGILLATSLWGSSSLSGLWSASVIVNDTRVPFRIGFSTENGVVKGWFYNGEDKINSTGGSFENEQLILNFDQYASRLEAKLSEGALVGSYGRTGRPAYPFRATPTSASAPTKTQAPEIAGNWEIAVKSPKGELAWRFVVRQGGPEVSATILRVDGDTGTLTGNYQDGRFVLSHFSGARPNLLEVIPQQDGTLQITQNGKTKYVAVREAAARAQNLPEPTDPFHHTTVKDSSEPFRFSFPNLNGKVVSNSDERFRGKVVVVAVSGSWCPNCHDEAPYLESLYKRYGSQGLEVVALSFEEEEQLKNPTRLRAFIKEYGIDYTVLLAGETGELHEKLPQAVNLNSWPTTFFLGRDGLVKGVHAGFAGAASGAFNKSQDEEITGLIEGLLGSNTRTSR
jgi:thiol-disulfide isomerase/thioredoxin